MILVEHAHGAASNNFHLASNCQLHNSKVCCVWGQVCHKCCLKKTGNEVMPELPPHWKVMRYVWSCMLKTHGNAKVVACIQVSIGHSIEKVKISPCRSSSPQHKFLHVTTKPLFSLSCFGSARGSRKGKAPLSQLCAESLTMVVRRQCRAMLLMAIATRHGLLPWQGANILEPMHCSVVGCWILGCPGTLFHDLVCLTLSQSHLRKWEDISTTESVASWLSFILFLIVVGYEYLPLVWAVAICDMPSELRYLPGLCH